MTAHASAPATTSPAVSVVMITNRTDDAVNAALEAIVAQTHRPIEVVLFGNGASFEVPPALSEAAGISVVAGHSPMNLGVAGGRNAATRLATTDYLLFVDDDAVLAPDAIAVALQAILEPGIGAVACRIVDPTSGQTALWFQPEELPTEAQAPLDVDVLLGGGNLVRRDVFDQLGGLWEGFFREMEDVDFSWRLVDAGWRILYAPRAVMYHPERYRRIYRHAIPSIVAMHFRLFPTGYALRESFLKLALFGLRAVRHREVREYLTGLSATPRAVRRALRERAQLRPETQRLLRRRHGTRIRRRALRRS